VRLAASLLALLALGVALSGCVSGMGGSVSGEALRLAQRSPNHEGDVFVNEVETEMSINPWDMLGRWMHGTEQRQPVVPIAVAALPAETLATASPGVRATWMGHASVLVELEGKRILTDPVWSDVIGPTSWLGPERFQGLPIALADLPTLDAVVISHDHYDHLDAPTITALATTGVHFYVPLGVGVHLRSWDVPDAQITELDWWETAPIDDGTVSLVCTPARHFSGRGPFDRNETLWASWAFVGDTHRVYFGGDTGMFEGFEAIGEAYGPFDLTLLPIGAYDPAWTAVHLNPEEAVQAHLAVRGGVLMPIHWGTFQLAMHTWNEPPARLAVAADEQAVTVVWPRAGQPVALAAPPPAWERWWEQDAVAAE